MTTNATQRRSQPHLPCRSHYTHISSCLLFLVYIFDKERERERGEETPACASWGGGGVLGWRFDLDFVLPDRGDFLVFFIICRFVSAIDDKVALLGGAVVELEFASA